MEDLKFKVIFKDPMCFEPHPLHEEIYGSVELDTDFKEDIRDYGVREPIVVNKEGLIISGRRRWTASISVGRTEIPIRIEEYPDELTEELALIAYNKQRVKTKTQIVKEIERLIFLHEKLGLSRKLKNLKPFQGKDTEVIPGQHLEEDTIIPENNTEFQKGIDYLNRLKKDAIPEKGRTNEIIADQVGTSPATVSRVKSVIDASRDEDPKISEPAKEIKENMEKGKIGFKTGAEKVKELKKSVNSPEIETSRDNAMSLEKTHPKGRGRPKGATSGPISTSGVKTLVQTRLADFTAESKGVEVLREWLVEQAELKSLEAKKLALKRGDKKVRESDFRRVLDKPAY